MEMSFYVALLQLRSVSSFKQFYSPHLRRVRPVTCLMDGCCNARIYCPPLGIDAQRSLSSTQHALIACFRCNMSRAPDHFPLGPQAHPSRESGQDAQ